MSLLLQILTFIGLLIPVLGGLYGAYQFVAYRDRRWLIDRGIEFTPESFVTRVRKGDKQLEVVRRFLGGGMPPDLPNADGETALVVAVLHGQMETIRLLLRRRCVSRPADPNWTTAGGLAPIDAAILMRREDIENELIAAGARPDPASGARLLLAAQDGDLDRVRAEISKRVRLDARTLDGGTALIEVAGQADGNPAIVEDLLGAGANPDDTNLKGRTALMAAAASRNVGCARALILHYKSRIKSYETSINAEDGNGDTAYDIARRRRGNGAVEDLLLDNGASGRREPDEALASQFESLLAGIKGGNQASQSLLQSILARQGFNPNAVGPDGRTFASKAAEADLPEVVESLADHRADLDLRDADGRTPLQVAVGQHALRSARALLARGVNADRQDAEGEAALHVASREGSVEMVDELLRYQADVNLAGRDGASPLLAAVESGQRGVVERLLAAGADPERADARGQTPLMAALLEGYEKIADLLRSRGVRAGEAEAKLILAAERGDAAEVRALLAAGARAGVVGRGGRSALLAAARRGRSAVIGLLLAAPAAQRPSLEETDDQGRAPLALAAGCNDAATVHALLAAGAKIDARRGDGGTALHEACREGHSEAVAALLAFNPRVDVQRRDGRTPLMLAVENGHVDVVRQLIAARADVNAVSREGESPLMLAVLTGDKEMADLLRQHGASRGEQEAELFLAARRGDAARVRELLAAGVPAGARASRGMSPLLAAAERGHLEVVKALVEAGANVNDRSGRRVCALERAAAGGHLQVVCHLLENGASPDLEGQGGRTPLMAACVAGRVQTAHALLEAKADPNARDRHGRTPLLIALLEGHQALSQLLATHGATAGQAEADLIRAAEKGQMAPVRHLLAVGAEVNALGTHRRTALVGACQGGYAQVAAALLDAGADTELRGPYGRTALSVAANLGAAGLVETILAKGAAIDLAGEGGRTPLLAAAAAGYEPIVQRLLTHHANPNLRDHRGDTAMMLAAREGHQAVVETLIARQASVGATGGEGRTALMAAAEAGRADVLRALLAGQAPIDARDANGSTALILASLRGQAAAVEVLLEAKADFDARDAFGNTPLMAAILEGHAAVEQLLRQAGAREGEKEALLLRAAEQGDRRRVGELLKDGANVNARRSQDDSALILAACTADRRAGEDHRGIVLDLLAAKADAAGKGRDGRTALMCAARAGDLEIVRELLDRGAYKVAEAVGEGDHRSTASMLASEAGHDGIVNLLAATCGALRPGDSVFVTDFGDRYHRRRCTFVKAGGTAMSLKEALAKGKRPCSFCLEQQ